MIDHFDLGEVNFIRYLKKILIKKKSRSFSPTAYVRFNPRNQKDDQNDE